MVPLSLFPKWLSNLTFQQQAVLMAAVRGQDGDFKDTGFKQIMWVLRGSIMKAAHLGRMLKIGEHAASFMSLALFKDISSWENVLNTALGNETDGAVLHYYTHLMHAAEILAYKHPDPEFRLRWKMCYEKMVHKLHLNPETEEQLDSRLGDFDREKWELIYMG